MQTTFTDDMFRYIGKRVREASERQETLTYPEAQMEYHLLTGMAPDVALMLKERTEADHEAVKAAIGARPSMLKIAVEAGTYRPSGEAIAERVLLFADCAERNARILETERARREDEFREEGGMRQDAGVFLLVTEETQAEESRPLSALEMGVILLLVGVTLAVLLSVVK